MSDSKPPEKQQPIPPSPPKPPPLRQIREGVEVTVPGYVDEGGKKNDG